MDNFPDKLLIEARNASINLEMLAVNDLDRNIDGYLQPNWRTRRMIDAWRGYVLANGYNSEAEYLNFRAAYSETEGKSNKVFSDVLATHIRNVNFNMSDTLFSAYVQKPGQKEETTVSMLNGEDGEDRTTDAWKKAIHGAARHLELHGWWRSKVLVPDAIVQRLKTKIENQMLDEHGNEFEAAVKSADGAPRQIKVGSRFTQNYEEMYEVSSDPFLLSVVQTYMGVPPIFNTPVAFLNSAVKAKTTRDLSDTAQLYHHDMHRLCFVKMFIYLTDVDEQCGPHMLVRGTHRKRPTKLWADGRHTDNVITEAGLTDDEVCITGKAGTLFLVDTSCLHKGAEPESQSRLMAQVQYANSLFGKPIAASDHKVEASLTSSNETVHEVAALVRKYAMRSGVRFMQNFI